MIYTNAQAREAIEQTIHSERDRRIMIRRLIDGICYEPLAEEFDMLKDRLATFLGAKVSLNISPDGKGKISIPFANEGELEHIMLMFDKMKR